MKNKERNEEVHYILNEDDKVDDSCPAARVCSIIEVNEVKLSAKDAVDSQDTIENIFKQDEQIQSAEG
uniref:Uncharacterized protein n=1 Tax=Tanacetum cinerariifolium TaxID=118510 RepID=A0A699V000_TANCI|nr:hypothetical protein [Tanacetum cinerariifolium]